MATFKALVLLHNKRSDGTFNVKIRVTHHREVKYLPTPFYVTLSQMTRTGKIKDKIVLDLLDNEILRLRKRVYEIGFIADSLSLEQLIRRIQTTESHISFTTYMQTKIDGLRNSRNNKTADTYQTALNSLLQYNKNAPLSFTDMTKAYMLEYYNYLLTQIKVLTANKYIQILKIFYDMARKELNDEESDIVVVKYRWYDAIEFERPATIPSRSFDTIDEMQAVIDVPYRGTWTYDFTKDMFILSFVCLGINAADLFRLKKSDYKDGILTYCRKKTERRAGSQSEIKIKVPIAGQIIINKYNGDPNYLIDFRGHKRSIEICKGIYNVFDAAGLNNTKKQNAIGNNNSKYVFYSARHTMATFARNICHVDKETVHEMLNHSKSKEFAMTDVYIRKDYTHLWEANDKLMSLFDWSFYTKQKGESI